LASPETKLIKYRIIEEDMDNLELLRRRRSIRSFQDKGISKGELEKIIDCARFAPTARDVQPWEFVVITEKSRLKKIAELAENGRFISQAAACVAVFCRETKYYLEDGCSAYLQPAFGCYCDGHRFMLGRRG
jgi:nitroreductase